MICIVVLITYGLNLLSCLTTVSHFYILAYYLLNMQFNLNLKQNWIDFFSEVDMDMI